MRTPRDDPSPGDWASRTTAHLDHVVELVRDRSVRPILGAVKFLILGVVASAVGLAALAAVLVGLIRLFDVDVFRGRVWATDFLFGGILLAAGGFLLRSSAKARRGSA
jgi:hypothetical protein